MATKLMTIGDLYTPYSICPSDLLAPENKRLSNGIENEPVHFQETQRLILRNKQVCNVVHSDRTMYFAAIIEIVVSRIQKTECWFFKKKYHITQLPSIFFDGANQLCFFPNLGEKKDCGLRESMKKVVGISFDPSFSPFPVMCKTNRIECEDRGEKDPGQSFISGCDLATVTMFGELFPYCPQRYASFWFRSERSSSDGVLQVYDRVKVYEEECGMVEDLLAGDGICAQDLLKIISDLARGVGIFHKRGYIHGGVTIPNARFRIVGTTPEDVRYDGVWTGLGFYESQKAATWIAHIRENGFYGPAFSTAPEVLGDANFQGDPFLVEAFAFGVFLDRLLHGSVPWEGELTYWQAGRVKVTLEIRSRYAQTVEKHITEGRERLSSEENVVYKYLASLAYVMMEPDPAARVSLVDAVLRIEGLKQVQILYT
jgi:hypothetical protein